jgi:hypothetical protein
MDPMNPDFITPILEASKLDLRPLRSYFRGGRLLGHWSMTMSEHALHGSNSI